MRSTHQNSARQTSGSILILGGTLFAVLCVAIVVAYSFGGLYFTHNRLQSSADEIALTGAKKLNENDRLGQMNNMVARCRQLVYSSREDYEHTKRDFPDLESFASPLLNESRQSATDMETERKTLTARVQAEAEAAMQHKFNEIKAGYALTLPWLSIHSPQLKMTAFGKVDGA